MTPTWPEVLSALVARQDLSADQSNWAMGEILAGEATPAQIAGFAVSLRAKGETVEEISGLVAAMYEQATRIEVTGRPQDAWLATWSRADAAVPHPIDPLLLAEAVNRLLASRVPATR